MKTSSNKYKLVVCDIDGTLTHDGTIIPSSHTLEVIEKLHSSNIGFGLASGRDIGQLQNLKYDWNLSFDFDLIIGLNGSEYYDLKHDTKEVLYSLSQEDIKDIIEKMLNKFPDLNVSVYRDNVRYLRFEDEMAIMSKKRNNMNNYYVKDISEMWEKPCPKVMFRVSEEVMRQIEPYAIEISNDRYRSCKTQSTMLEFVHRNSDKGNALKAYCERNSIDLKEVVSFGDMDNDKEMLEVAGLGVCMKNGSDKCKESANAISELDNNEDGCAYFIEKYIL